MREHSPIAGCLEVMVNEIGITVSICGLEVWHSERPP
jgi:hypothetical protein